MPQPGIFLQNATNIPIPALLYVKWNHCYTMTQFYIPSLQYVMPQFDSASLESAQSYYDHLKYTIPMIQSFIELNHLELQEIDFDIWDILLAQRMLDPM